MSELDRSLLDTLRIARRMAKYSRHHRAWLKAVELAAVLRQLGAKDSDD